MNIPTLEQAQAMLAEAEQLNPTPWVAHSRYVAESARLIAQQVSQLDPQDAYILGLLHDIGRRGGPSHLKHVFDGYLYFSERGFTDTAQICLTHSFPTRDLRSYPGSHDISEQDEAMLRQQLAAAVYTPYDRLIMLCDALCLPSGWCLMEKRLLDVVRRYGFNELTLQKWEAYFAILAEFDAACGASIYRLLPGVAENTFGLPLECPGWPLML